MVADTVDGLELRPILIWGALSVDIQLIVDGVVVSLELTDEASREVIARIVVENIFASTVARFDPTTPLPRIDDPPRILLPFLNPILGFGPVLFC